MPVGTEVDAAAGRSPVRSWPDGSPRILVSEAWLANAGDAAITWALDRILRRVAPGAAIVHAAYQHHQVGPAMGDLVMVPPLEHLVGTPWSAPKSDWAGVGDALVAGADLVVAQGGGYLVEGYSPLTRIGALAEVVRRGRPVVLFGLTIGAFQGSLARSLLGEVLRAADLVMVRDPVSVRTAADLGRPDVVLGTDLALDLFAPQSGPPATPGSVLGSARSTSLAADPGSDPGSDRRGVSLVLTDHHPDRRHRSRRQRTAERLLDLVLDRAAGEPVTLWSTVQGMAEAAGEDDSAVARAAVQGLTSSAAEGPGGGSVRTPGPRRGADRRRSELEVVLGYLPPDQVIDRVARSRALVTMRMHPALFAAATATPAALVLGDQRVGVLAGTALADSIADPADPVAVERLVEAVLGETAPAPWRRSALDPLFERLEASVDRLAAVVGRSGPNR